MADVLTKPKMSLIRQSFASQERAPTSGIPSLSYKQSSLNGDGYGVAWYGSVGAMSTSEAGGPVGQSAARQEGTRWEFDFLVVWSWLGVWWLCWGEENFAVRGESVILVVDARIRTSDGSCWCLNR